MAETFTIFGLEGYLYGLCAFIGAVLMMLGMRLADRKLPQGTVSLFGITGIVLGIICARALYCAVNWSEFVHNYENPRLMLNWVDGGLSMAGLLLGLLLAAALTAKVQKISFARLMDAISIPFGLLMAALRFGEQFTDLGVGAAVEGSEKLSWLLLESRMGVMVEYRLNVWLYEAIAGVVLFLIAVHLFHKLRDHAGDTALIIFSLFGASQILLESMRDDGHMLVIFLRIGQLAAFLIPLAACIILSRRVQCKKAVLIAWLVILLCVAMVVVLEFSLDGRLTFGTPTLLRDWSLMAAACAVLASIPCVLLHKARKA